MMKLVLIAFLMMLTKVRADNFSLDLEKNVTLIENGTEYDFDFEQKSALVKIINEMHKRKHKIDPQTQELLKDLKNAKGVFISPRTPKFEVKYILEGEKKRLGCYFNSTGDIQVSLKFGLDFEGYLYEVEKNKGNLQKLFKRIQGALNNGVQ